MLLPQASFLLLSGIWSTCHAITWKALTLAEVERDAEGAELSKRGRSLKKAMLGSPAPKLLMPNPYLFPCSMQKSYHYWNSESSTFACYESTASLTCLGLPDIKKKKNKIKIHMQLPEAVIHNWKLQGAGLTGLLAWCILDETLNQHPDYLYASKS